MDVYLLTTWLRARLHSGEEGASFAEYVMVVSLVAIICLVAVRSFGKSVSTNFSQSASTIGN